MTPTQRTYLQAVAALIADQGHSPTLREVAARVDRKHSSVSNSIVALERQGLIVRGYRSGRTMRLTEAGKAALREGGG